MSLSTWERTDEGIIYKPAEFREVPALDILTLLFESPWSDAKDDTVLNVDADHPEKAITKAEVRPLLKRVSYILRHSYGVGKNGPNRDTVLVIAAGHWQLPTLFYGIVGAGGVFSAASPSATPKELAGQFNLVEAKLIFCTIETKDVAIAAAKLAGLPLSRVILLGPGRHFELIEQQRGRPVVLHLNALEWPRIVDRQQLDASTICILFSSGTTGAPKGVRLSHTNMVAGATLVLDPMKEYHRETRSPDNPFVYRTIAHLPAAHIAGIQGYLINPVYMGGTVYWMPRFDFAKFLQYCKKYRITNFFSVPPIYLAIAKSPLVTDQFDSLEFAISGAAPLGKELQLVAQKKMGKGQIFLSQTWGLSETTGSFTVMPRTLSDETGSVSTFVSSCVARIVDDEGKDVEPGQPGEIWCKGPVVTKGYWKNDKANKEAFVNGWFCTGDIGLWKDGLLYIVDRKKELIKYKGHQVAPAELEALLLSHAKILDAAVIGVDGGDTEVPRAYIVADPKQITAEEVAAWVASQVSSYKRLRGGVIFLPAIPKSLSGKILRKDLRELAKREKKTSKL